MLLAIDAGNTNIVFALCDGDEIKARWRIASMARTWSASVIATVTNSTTATAPS